MYSKEHLILVHSASIRPEDLLTFVQVDPFPAQWGRLKLTEADLQILELRILAEPLMGTVIPGTKGLRKARFSIPGSDKGKSGSFRVFYFYARAYGTVFLWAIIAKGVSDDLSMADRNAIATEIERTKRILKRGVKL